jgi:hypothetical protein
MMKQFQKYRLFFETGIIVFLILVFKLLIVHFSLEVFGITPLFTSVIAGGVFIISIIISGILSDYKESDKIPAEITASIEAIHQEGILLKNVKEGFHLSLLQKKLISIIDGLTLDIQSVKTNSRKALEATETLSDSFQEMETLDMPPNYIVRLKQEQQLIRQKLLRIYHIQKIQFVPSAYILAETLVVLIIGLLLFTRIKPVYDGIMMVAFVSYLFIFLLKLLHVLESPFRAFKYSMDDICLFILKELREKISRELQA